MTETKYHFPNLSTRDAIIVQRAIEQRKMNMPIQDSSNKVIKAVLEEIDQLYDDLDRHIAAEARQQEYQKISKGT
jgi:L-serine deaminase